MPHTFSLGGYLHTKYEMIVVKIVEVIEQTRITQMNRQTDRQMDRQGETDIHLQLLHCIMIMLIFHSILVVLLYFMQNIHIAGYELIAFCYSNHSIVFLASLMLFTHDL